MPDEPPDDQSVSRNLLNQFLLGASVLGRALIASRVGAAAVVVDGAAATMIGSRIVPMSGSVATGPRVGSKGPASFAGSAGAMTRAAGTGAGFAASAFAIPVRRPFFSSKRKWAIS
ncbi:MAG: hypothetical protein EXQ90_07755 [Rhodospirillales bacterium]|nr:hypothetical protein [Rhodospirillales bacterium]